MAAFLSVGCQTLPGRSSSLLKDEPAIAKGSETAAPEKDPQSDAPKKDSQASASKKDSQVAKAQAAAPTEGPGASGGRGFLGIPPVRQLLNDVGTDDEDEPRVGDSPYFPEARTDPISPDIRKPGPDIANFPNAAYTLAQGRFYIEASPVFISGPSIGSAKTYNAEFLIRYGLTDKVELRIFSNGPTAERGRFAGNGMAPLAYDLKINFWKDNDKYWIPAVGLEVYILTASGSKSLNQGTQPSVNLLFDHNLPFDFLLEWNVGMVGDPSPNNKFAAIEPSVTWALQHEIVEGLDAFIQGYYNGPTLPRFGDGIELGGGVVWALNNRIALWASYNGGVSPAAPTTIFYAGSGVAF